MQTGLGNSALRVKALQDLSLVCEYLSGSLLGRPLYPFCPVRLPNTTAPYRSCFFLIGAKAALCTSHILPNFGIVILHGHIRSLMLLRKIKI